METLTRANTIVNLCIQDILNLTDLAIEEVQIIKLLPIFLQDQILFSIHNNIGSMVPPDPSLTLMNQETMDDIPHLSVDSLMPKNLNKQQKIDSIQNNSSLLASSISRKKLSLLARNNLLQTTHSRPQSLILSSRKSKNKDITLDSRFQILKPPLDMDDPQIQQLRGKTEMRLHGDQQYRKLTLQRESSFHQKSSIFSSLMEDDPNSIITHDYDGEQLKSVQNEDKIKHYSLRTGIGPGNKKYKDNGLAYNGSQARTIEVGRSIKQRQASRSLKPMQMPLFPQPRLDPVKMQGFQSYRLQQYKKHFAKGFSRLDRANQTIEFPTSKDIQDDPFAEKKHLKDSQQISILQNSSLKESNVTRKLALPRLHGKYKVLDRYSKT